MYYNEIWAESVSTLNHSFTYDPLAPGLELHGKFVEEFLKKCSVSHLSTHLFIPRLGWGWFCSSIHELLAGSCTKKKLEGVPKDA